VRSVANLTRRDGIELLDIAARAKLQTTISVYPLERTNDALDDLRHGRFEGSAVVQLH
jgi:propanol-preferring alcohol dehydrogenase